MNKYLVTYEIEGEVCEPVIETAMQIFNKMGMDDCYDISILSLRLLVPYKNRKDFYENHGLYPACEFYGTWCCKDPQTGRIDPLRMEIRRKFVDKEIVYDVGYGTDH